MAFDSNRQLRVQRIALYALTATVAALMGYLLGNHRDKSAAVKQSSAACDIGPLETSLTAIGKRLARVEHSQEETLGALRASRKDADSQASGSSSRSIPAASALERPSWNDETAVVADDATLLASQRLIDSAVQAGRWTEEDKISLQTMSANLSPEQELELKRSLSQSINEGRLRIETATLSF